MDTTSTGLHDKLVSLSKSDLLANRKDEPNGKTMEPIEASGDLVQRCVIIQRDEKGYGLTVSGDNPVFVQVVKEDGAAARAGVLQGDRIIKVNGTLVTQSNHQEVVKLIKSGSYVALTLLGKSPGQSGVRINPVIPIAIPTHSPAVQNQANRLSSSSERITGPQPVDPEKQQELTNTRIHTIKKMYDKEVVFLENLQAEYLKNPSDVLCQQQIFSATKRVKTLEEQLKSLTGYHPEYAAPRSPRSPPTLRQCHSESSRTMHSNSPAHGHGKHLTHQTSAPSLQKAERSPGPSPLPSDDGMFLPPSSPIPTSHPPPAHHGRQNSRNVQNNSENWTGFPGARPITVSTSLENLSKNISNKTTTWPHAGPTHSRQSSSPESLLHNIRSLQQHPHPDRKKVTSPEWSLTRSHSELGQQCYPRKMSANDALNDCDATTNNKSGRPSHLPYRGTSFHHFDFATESPHNSPPATPPPSSVDALQDGFDVKGIDVDEFYGTEEGACVPIPECLHETSSTGSLSYLNSNDSGYEILETLSPLTPKFFRDDSSYCASTPESSSSAITSPTGISKYGTPPEDQSSPTSSMMTHMTSKSGQTPFIVCMEDEELSSDSEGPRDDHGPFNSLWKLLKNQAHLAVFMQYLISNRSPASLFFYIISNIYEGGTGKEMKKWAYEIHSTFLVPGAPLRVTNIEETILLEIDDGLQHHLEKEDTLRPLFRKARKKAKENLNSLLGEFRNKRAIGLGNIYGPPDYQLEEAINDKNKELKIIEQVLVPSLEKFSEDPEALNDEDSALGASLATILKQFGVRQQALSLVDKWPTFVAKEKSRLKFLQRNKKSVSVQSHQFVPQHYCSVTYCNHCQNIIWGVGNQGYQCQHCEMNIHKSCVKVVEESCIGAFKSKKDKRRDRYSGLMENIIGKSRKPSHPNISAIERAKRLNEEAHIMDSNYHDTHISDPVERSNSGVLRVDKLRERFEAGLEEAMPLGIPPGVAENIEKMHSAKKGSSIGRSESFRQRRESKPSFRKRSDPNIPRSKSDVEVESNLNNSGSSSNSSLSARYVGLDSPSNSQEMVHNRTASGTTTTDSISGNATTITTGVSSTTSSLSHPYDDSDLEAEADPPNWQESVDWDFLKMMKPKEKKRQDVINELFHTERTHVRNLKVLERVFYRPILQDQLLPSDQLQLLFPNLQEILEIHGSFNKKMKSLRKEETIIGDIGASMLQMLDGQSGEQLKKAAAIFCRNQSMALEILKSRQRKDQKLSTFLSESEANNVCRRLQLKDIIVTGFQRLTKYPLLLENVAKYTTPNSEEHVNLLKSVECSKQILAHVNQAVKEAENIHRLTELQKNLDKSSFIKMDSPIAQAFRHLDFNNHKLVYEGPLTWKLNKQKSIDVHVVLLEDILVLLLKQDEKYVLKFQNINITTSKEDAKMPHSPILRVENMLTRNVATDKKGFFLVTTSDLQHAIYEFSAASAAERKIWLRHITEAIDDSLQKVKSRNQETVVVDRKESAEENNEDLESRINDTAPQDSHLEPNDQMEHQEGGNNFDMSPQDGQHETSDESISSQPAQQDNSAAPSQEDSQSTGVAGSSPSSKLDDDDDKDPSQRRLQRVEILKIADGPQLIEPYEVVVRPSAVLQTAEPVLTPVEQLKRKDMQIRTALAEKEELVAKILQVPKEEFEHILEMAEEGDGEKDVQELLLSAINQANRLTKLLNETLRVTEEDAISATSLDDVRNSPSPKIGRKYGRLVGSTTSSLRSISSSLNKYLTQLLVIVSSREEERKQLRKELYNSREQIHLMHEAHRHCSIRSRSPSSSGNHSASQQSRPNSFVSIASSTSEGVCDLHQVSAEELTLLANPLTNSVAETRDIDACASVENVENPNPHSLETPLDTSESTNELNGVKDTDRDSLVTLTTSMTSEEGGGEMFVDAPSFPTNSVSQEKEDKQNIPVTDLDSNFNQSSLVCEVDKHDCNKVLIEENSEENNRNNKCEDNITKDSQSVGAKEMVVDSKPCNEEKQQQQGSELVDPIYF